MADAYQDHPHVPPAVDSVWSSRGGAPLWLPDGDNLAQALGFVGWTQDPRWGTLVSHQATSGIVHGNAIWIPRGTVVSRVDVYIVTAGVGVTDAWVGIYDRAYNLQAVSADTPAYANATGWGGANLTAPWTAPRSDFYYLADLYIGGTMPFYTSSGQVVSGGSSQLPSPGNPLMWWQQVGQSSLPATAAPVTSSVPHMMAAR